MQGSARPGLRIMGTTDGGLVCVWLQYNKFQLGLSWREQLYVPDVFERIFDLKCASVTEWYSVFSYEIDCIKEHCF